MEERDTTGTAVPTTILQAILDRLPVDVLVHDRATIIYANHGTARTLGYEHPHDLAGLPISTIVHPDSRDAGIQRRALLFATGQHFPSVPIKLQMSDGSSVSAEGMARTFQVGDETMAIVVRGVFGGTAVTPETLVTGAPRLPAQTPFCVAILDSLPLPVVVHDGTVILYANEAAAKGIGLPSANALIGQRTARITHPDELEASRERGKAMLDAGLQFQRIHSKIRSADGTPIYAVCSGGVADVSDERYVYWVVEQMDLAQGPQGARDEIGR